MSLNQLNKIRGFIEVMRKIITKIISSAEFIGDAQPKWAFLKYEILFDYSKIAAKIKKTRGLI